MRERHGFSSTHGSTRSPGVAHHPGDPSEHPGPSPYGADARRSAISESSGSARRMRSRESEPPGSFVRPHDEGSRSERMVSEESPCPGGNSRVGDARPDHGWPGHRRPAAVAAPDGSSLTSARRRRRTRDRPASAPSRRAAATRSPPAPTSTTRGAAGTDRLRIERQVVRAIKATKQGRQDPDRALLVRPDPGGQGADRGPQPRRARPAAAQRPPGHPGDEDDARSLRHRHEQEGLHLQVPLGLPHRQPQATPAHEVLHVHQGRRVEVRAVLRLREPDHERRPAPVERPVPHGRRQGAVRRSTSPSSTT